MVFHIPAEKLDMSSDRISEYKKVGFDEYVRMKYTGHHRSLRYEEEQEILDSFASKAK